MSEEDHSDPRVQRPTAQPDAGGWMPRTSFNPEAPASEVWTGAEILTYAAVLGSVIGIAVGLLVAGAMSIDYFTYRHVPAERALVSN